MGRGDKIEEHFEKRQERKKREAIISDDDAPIPDVPVEQAQAEDKVGRNDPCSCGSGKKFKKCCGKPS